MGGKYVKDHHVKLFQTITSQVRRDLGRTIYIYVVNSDPTVTTEDGYDPINKEQVNPSDTLERDETVYTITDVSIKYGPESEQFILTPGGRLEDGEVRVKMDLSKVLVDPSDVNGDTLFDSARIIVVDGRDYVLKGKPIKGGLRDLYSLVARLKLADVD
jgi:hypothetical protein